MIVLRNVAVIGIAALAISGCSSTGSGGSDDNGPSYLHGYNPTIYQDGATLSQARAEGIEGLAVTVDGGTSSKITTAADRINVVVDGNTYDFPLHESGQYGDYTSARYIDPDTPYSEIFTYDRDYSGFAAILDDETGGPHTLIVTGQETERLPSQQASYEGDWITASQGRVATFSADADFDARRIDYTVNGGRLTGAGQAQIVGSQFEGNIDFTGTTTGSGSIAGAFFGPSANEVGGTSRGTVDGQDYQAVFHASQE